MLVLYVSSKPLNEHYYLDTTFPNKQLQPLSFSVKYASFGGILKMAILSFFMSFFFVFHSLHIFLANPTLLQSEMPKGIYSFVSHFLSEN